MENGNGFAEGFAVGRDSGNNNGMWSGDWAWILIILLFAGWGNGGFGGYRGGNGSMEGYVLTTDFATLERKMDGINNGICSLGYQLQGDLCNGFANTLNAITTNGYETRNAIQGVSSQIASCCCDIQKSLLENRYIACQNTRDIIDSQREGTSAILSYLNNEKISSLTAENALLKGQISQTNQTNCITSTILGTLAPRAIPAYPVFPQMSFAYPNGVTFGINGNNGFGCGCNGANATVQ